jgi:DNA repair protein RadA/Sms
MAKVKSVFYCQNCGAQSPKWIGKCPSCNEWNSYVEEIVDRTSSHAKVAVRLKATPKTISEIQIEERHRFPLIDAELNRVLGGGLVPGSLILFGGEPGIGKSTLLLQLALQQMNFAVLYVSGEESEEQIQMRAKRLNLDNPSCQVLMETSCEQIIAQLENLRPNVAIIDSIQTLQSEHIESAPGSVSQVRECTLQLMKFAKETHTPVFLIGHITKDGSLAGPKVLEHMVDVVLQFEGDRHHIYRILRSHKNRFGSTNELGIYEMMGAGLRAVENPSDILIDSSTAQLSGSSIAAAMEGGRPMLMEIQALVSTAVYGTPQRSTTGYDLRRMNMLLAVLEKRCGFRLGMKDVFLNIAGGIKIEDPALDLAVITSILSSNEDIAVPRNTCFCGEVGLSGEIRPVARLEQRIQEATKLGFERIFISSFHKQKTTSAIEVVEVSKVEELFGHIFA